jgi:hypothetical protein
MYDTSTNVMHGTSGLPGRAWADGKDYLRFHGFLDVRPILTVIAVQTKRGQCAYAKMFLACAMEKAGAYAPHTFSKVLHMQKGFAHAIDPWESHVLVLSTVQMIGLCFTYLFVCEFALKCTVLGFVKYLSDTNNWVDFAVVCTGMAETYGILISMNCKLGAPSDASKDHCIETGGSGLGALRCARLLKLAKLLNKFPSVAYQLNSILRSMADAFTVLFLLAISTFVFAILGVNIFGSKIRIDDLGSPFAALGLIRPGARMLVAGPPRYNESTETLPKKLNPHQEFPAIIKIVDFALHPVRPLHVQPVYGYTFSSKPSKMLPFWSVKPEVLSKSTEHNSKVHQKPQTMTLVAAIPRFNADTFWDGLLAAFQISLGVDFGESFTLSLGAGKREVADTVLSYVFFILVILLGNWILFNCFIATMIVGFRREAILSAQTKTRQSSAAKNSNSRARKENSMLLNTERFTKRIERMAVDGRSTQEVISTIKSLSSFQKKERMRSGGLLAQALMAKQLELEKQLEAITKQEYLAIGDKNPELVDRCRILTRYLSSNLRMLDDGIMILTAPDTFGIFDALNPVRIKTLGVVRSNWFQQSINLLLVIAMVCLAIERRDIGVQERNVLNVINLGLNVLFTVELLLKSFAFSVQSYLKDPLNRLDCIIVAFGLVDIALALLDLPLIKAALVPSSGTEIIGVLKVLRIVKTMRPLRMLLFKIERVRIVASAIKQSIGPLQLALAIALALVLVLGIFAQQLFAGRMSACSDPNIYHRSACSGLDADGYLRVWRAADLNCDWIGDSIVLIFTAISKDRWRSILWSLTDITGRESGPYVDFSWYYSILILVAVIIGSVFTLNLLVALFVESYTKEMVLVRQHIYDTPRSLALQGRHSLPPVWNSPKKKWQGKVLKMLESKLFRRFLAFIFFANLFVAALEGYKGAGWVTEFKRIGNALLAITFGGEATVKMLVLGPARYFDVNENIRDFISALLTLAGEALYSSINQGSTGAVGQYFQDQIFVLVGRLLSVARLIGWLRVLRSQEDLEAMTNILLLAGGIVVQTFGILLIAMFVFGVIGVQMMGNICSPEQSAVARRTIVGRSLELVTLQGKTNIFPEDLIAASALSNTTGVFYYNSDELRCLLGSEEFQLPNWMQFNHLGSAILTLFVAAMRDGWGKIMIATSVVSSVHPRSPGHMERAVPLLKTYLRSPLSQAGQMALDSARREFPGCITGKELQELGTANLLDCSADGGAHCESTCGSSASKLYFILYLMVSNVMILNIIVAALLEQVAAAELPLQGALTVGLSLRKFNRTVNLWKKHAMIRNRLKVSPDPTLSVYARDQREVARENGLREEMEVHKQERMEAKEARKLLLERRHAWRYANQVQQEETRLIDQMLQASEFESRAQHLDDLFMAKQLAKHLRRHRQRERQLLERWRESLPSLVRQALVLDHWTGLPTIDFQDKERKLDKLSASCKTVAQDRDKIWAAAAPDLEMQQGIMQDVSQFLVFLERELEAVRLMMGTLANELEALSDSDPAAIDSNVSTHPAHQNRGERHRASDDRMGASANLLADFDALREQLKTNRIQVGKTALQKHVGALVQVLELRRSVHLQQAHRTQQLVEEETMALEPINIPRNRASSCREPTANAVQEDEESMSTLLSQQQRDLALNNDLPCQEKQDFFVMADQKGTQKAILDDHEQAPTAVQAARSRASVWRDSLDPDKIETVQSLVRHRLADDTGRRTFSSGRSLKSLSLVRILGDDLQAANAQTAHGDKMPSVTGMIGHVTSRSRRDESSHLSQGRHNAPETLADGRASATRSAAGFGATGTSAGTKGVGKLIGGEAMLKELGIIPLHELEHRNGLLLTNMSGGSGHLSVTDRGREVGLGSVSSGMRGDAVSQVKLHNLLSGLEITKEMEESLSFTGFNSFAQGEVVVVRRKDASLTFATIFQELPGNLA